MLSIKVGDTIFSVGTDWEAILDVTDFTETIPKSIPAVWFINGEKLSRDDFEKRWNDEKTECPPPPYDVHYVYPFLIDDDD